MSCRRLRIASMLAALAPLASHAAAPSMNDYARGVVIESDGAHPLIEIALPDEIYQAATRGDLRDLRVFNSEGEPVPHAFCVAPETSEAAVTTRSLPVFELRHRAQGARDDVTIKVQTAAGARLTVEERADGVTAPAQLHIVDARTVDAPLRSMQFDWSSPDEASQAQVRIEASDDLDRWVSIVATSTLLRAEQGGQELRRERIALPLRAYKYLRVQRIDDGPPLSIRAVSAEVISPAVDIEPRWFTPTALAPVEAHELLFDAARVAPVRFARLRLQQENSSLNVTLQSRPDAESPWRERWSGETYRVVTDEQRRESPPARFAPTVDRHWRVLLPKEAQPSHHPAFELGYRPLLLRFLALGTAPHTLAAGSRRAGLATPLACDGLLADIAAKERELLTGAGAAAAFTILGGEHALKPAPAKTPMRMIVLWGVLIVGVALLVAMAVSLLKRVRQPQER